MAEFNASKTKVIYLPLVSSYFHGFSFFILILLLCIGMGCKNEATENDDFGVRDPSNAGGYVADPNTIKRKNIHVSIKTRSDLKAGTLVVMMRVKNNGERSIMVNYMDCVLNVGEERVVVPRLLRPYKSVLAYGDEESYAIYFQPINSIAFYNNTGYHGDMKQRYTLKLDFVTDVRGNRLLNDRVELTLPDSAYHNYLMQNARQPLMNIFSFNFDEAAFEKNELQYLRKMHRTDSMPAIYAVNPSLTINRMILNFFGYKEKDTLIVNMRLLNEDVYPLKVIPSKCVVKASGKTYQPVHIFSDSFHDHRLPDSTYIFKSGTRLHLKLKYVIPRALDQWTLSNNWLLMPVDASRSKWKALLFRDLMFHESVATKVH